MRPRGCPPGRRRWPGAGRLGLAGVLLAAPVGCGGGGPAGPEAVVLYSGSLYANDAGEAHGGWEWEGRYRATVEERGGQRLLRLVFEEGPGDPLAEHSYPVEALQATPERLALSVEGRRLLLVRVERDTVWGGRYDGYFIAARSLRPEEARGELPAGVFRGLPEQGYVEIRLRSPFRPLAAALSGPPGPPAGARRTPSRCTEEDDGVPPRRSDGRSGADARGPGRPPLGSPRGLVPGG